ncbi:MAG: polysaccharide biosynthesis tyrosine autokinase [Paludibacter sp.]|nr:polysaccharide biosynthesis tyrosine autokinase [Paludibacter sp.]
MDNYLEQFEQEIQEKPINWREIFDKIIYHWKWFVLSAVTAMIFGAIYGRMQNDVYEVKSSLLIIDQSKSGQMNEMSLLKQLDAAGLGSSRSSYTMINNEEQVLKSTALMKRVVDRLELYTSYSTRKFLRTENLYTASPIYVKLDSLSLYKLKSGVSLTVTPEKGQLIVEGSYNDVDFTNNISKLPATVKTPAGNITFELRAGETFPEEEVMVNINNPLKVAKSIVNNMLTTEVAKLVDIIDLTVQTNNIQNGQDILNTLVDIYNQDASEQNNQSAINTAQFIDTRLKLLTTELSNVELSMENYKQANKLTDINADAEMYLSKNSIYDQQQIQGEIQQHLIKYVEDFIHDPSNKSALIPNLGLQDVGLAAVIERYNELMMTRDRIAQGSSAENPALKSLNQEISMTLKAIQTGIVTGRKGLQVSNNDIKNQNQLMQSKIKDIPRQEREYIEIKRQQQVKESLYLFMLQKREEASLNIAVSVPKGRVLNAPDDATLTGPHRKIILLIFLLIGLLIPGIIIYILELLNTSIHSRADVEKLSDIPIITELETNKTDDMIINYTSNASSNSELFRLMRTKLQFTLDHPTEKVILVTSTMSGEGKTFISINLSIMLSLTDKKVILLGMDLRNPQLSKHFGITAKDGISAYLSGQTTDFKSLISKPSAFPTLHILPTGVIPPNPTELIMKERFDEIITELRKEYDYIVIDSAPVGAVSDSYLIDRVSDLTLYVCRAGVTDKRNIEFVNRIQEEKSLKRIFFVVNDVNFESGRYYAYHSHYGYGKKYGYGYGQKKK